MNADPDPQPWFCECMFYAMVYIRIRIEIVMWIRICIIGTSRIRIWRPMWIQFLELPVHYNQCGSTSLIEMKSWNRERKNRQRIRNTVALVFIIQRTRFSR